MNGPDDDLRCRCIHARPGYCCRQDPEFRKPERGCMFTQYRRKQIAELRLYEVGEVLSGRVSISAADLDAGSPKAGDMIARNPKNHDDQWLVAADYFADNFEPIAP